jgi:hypothetical protein
VFSREPIYVSLSPSSVRVCVIARGEIARVERIRIEDGEFAKAWVQDLRPIDEPLRTALNALKVAPGTPAQVLFHSPGALAEVFLSPASGSSASRAAHLYITQMLGGATSKWVVTQRELGVMGSVGGAPARHGILLCGDERAHLDSIAGWLRRAGLTPRSAMPSRSAALADVVRTIPSASADARVRVRMDEHAIVLAGWQGGGLVFARSADVGYAQLIEAVSRASRTTPEPLSMEGAARWLFSFGLPGHVSYDDGVHGEMFRALLPLVQPSLQRFVVEVRQTMRFGFTDADLARVSIELIGPGASIPGLASSLSDMLDGAVELQTNADAPLSASVAEDQLGDLPLVLRVHERAGWIEPPAERERREQCMIRQAGRAGAAVAACSIGLLAWNTTRESKLLDFARDELAPDYSMIESETQASELHGQKSSELQEMLGVVKSGMQERVSWRGVISDVVGLLHNELELQSLDARTGNDGTPTLTLRGRVTSGARASGPDPIGAFVQGLQESLLVESARVVSTQIDSEPGGAEFHVEIVPARLSIVVRVLVDAERAGEAP